VTPPDHDRLMALSAQLFEVHDWLREQLADLRAGLGDGTWSGDLRTHCVTFCSVLRRHHTDEDDQLFPALAGEHPALADVLATLRRDHDQVAEMLDAIDALLRRPGPRPEIAAELEGLSAVLESHLMYEERKLTAVLGSVRGPLDLTAVLPAGS
jgi:iron-sulfur cluster repair protein YtfE (RIC family)